MKPDTKRSTQPGQPGRSSPGPWTWDGETLRRADGARIANCRFGHGIVSMRITSAEREANGRLLAEAPALREALEELLTTAAAVLPEVCTTVEQKACWADVEWARSVLQRVQIPAEPR